MNGKVLSTVYVSNTIDYVDLFSREKNLFPAKDLGIGSKDCVNLQLEIEMRNASRI